MLEASEKSCGNHCNLNIEDKGRFGCHAQGTYRGIAVVTYNGHKGIRKSPLFDSVPILLQGFYECYSLGKNAKGDSFPDRGGADSFYGGRSIWGEIDGIASRYGWSYDYILWGISHANLRMMMADAIRTDYKAGKTENKDNGIPDTLDMSKPGSMEWLKRLAGK